MQTRKSLCVWGDRHVLGDWRRLCPLAGEQEQQPVLQSEREDDAAW